MYFTKQLLLKSRDSKENYWVFSIHLSPKTDKRIFTFYQQIWTSSWQLQEDFWDLWGACWTTANNRYRLFFNLLESRFWICFKAWKDFPLLHFYCDLLWWVFVPQAGSLHIWEEVFSVWGLDFLRLGMSPSTTSLMARPSCINLTSRMARSPTSTSKSVDDFIILGESCRAIKMN